MSAAIIGSPDIPVEPMRRVLPWLSNLTRSFNRTRFPYESRLELETELDRGLYEQVIRNNTLAGLGLDDSFASLR